MSDPIKWIPMRLGFRSDDWLYRVGPTYTREGEKWRAAIHASAQNVNPIGAIRDTAVEAKADAQAEKDRVAALGVTV